MTLSNNDEEDIDFRTVLKEGAVGLITVLEYFFHVAHLLMKALF